MKKLFNFLLSFTMLLGVVGCSNGGEGGVPSITSNIKPKYQPTYKTEVKYKNNSLKGILNDIYADQEELQAYLESETNKLVETPIETFDDFLEFIPKIEELLKLNESEAEKYLHRLDVATYAYYNMVDEKYKEEEFDSRGDAVDELYYAVYDNALSSIMDAVYDGTMTLVMDHYYDGLLSDYLSDDNLSYKKVSETSSDVYKLISRSMSDYYKLVSRYMSDWYKDYSRINSLIYNDDFDKEHLDRILDDPNEETE